MVSLARQGFGWGSLVAALLVSGCTTSAEKQEDAPTTTAAPTATASATATVTASATIATPPVVAPPRDLKADAGPTGADAGPTSTDAGPTVTTDAGPTSDGGVLPATGAAAFKACSDKCQAVLQSCAIPAPSRDGGLPQMKDPVACQAAATACFAACKP